VLSTKYWFILAKQFQIRRFLEIDQSNSGIACGSHYQLTNMAATGKSCFLLVNF
jgi:hypothetical protein